MAGVRVHERCRGRTAIGDKPGVVIIKMTLIEKKIAPIPRDPLWMSAPRGPSFSRAT